MSAYRARIRFRVAKKLNFDGVQLAFGVNQRQALLQARDNDVLIRDSDWLVVNARGFACEDDAKQFGSSLIDSLHLSAAVCRLGLDPGQNLPTAQWSEEFRQLMARETGCDIRDDTHGLDVFADEPNVKFVNMHLTAAVYTDPTSFLSFVSEFYDMANAMTKESRDVLLLLNFALMRPDPIAQIVFCISAVEMLGQSEDWSVNQKEMLNRLVAAAKTLEGDCVERAEVVDAIRRGMHRLSLRQGVFRLLDRLNLSSLKKSWDSIYSERSRLVHGLAPVPGESYGDLANRATTLCGQILLRWVAQDVPVIEKYIDQYYPGRA